MNQKDLLQPILLPYSFLFVLMMLMVIALSLSAYFG